MFARSYGIPNIDFVFITYNYLLNVIEKLGGNNLSLSTQLEQFQRKKAELKNELQSMEQREKALGETIKMLEEKMAIQELEEKVKAKRAVVERLESKKRDLVRRLKEPQKREPMEVTVSAAPAGSQQPKKPEEQKEKQEEKKKRKWF